MTAVLLAIASSLTAGAFGFLLGVWAAAAVYEEETRGPETEAR